MTFHPTREQSIADGPPRRSRLSRVIPVLVIGLTCLLVAWSAWPTIRPVPSVSVTQAVFDRSLDEPASIKANEPPANQQRPGPTVQAPGWLEPEPFYTACTALADGVLKEIFVLEGDLVAKDQIVAKLVSEDSEIRLRTSEADLQRSRSELLLAEAELNAAQTDWDEPVEQVRAVETSSAALEESRAELAMLPSQIAAERAMLVRHEEEFKRTQRSLEVGAVNDLEAIIAEQRVRAQRAIVESLEKRRPLLEARVKRLQAELKAAKRDLELRVDERLALEAAKARVEGARTEMQRAQSLRDEAALELDRMTIRAPIDGYVMRRLKLPGDKVVRMNDNPHSAHLVHLYEPDHIQVRVDVPLADASHIYVGQQCEVIVEVLPDLTFRGEVLRITHEADLQKNTLQVKVRVLDPSPDLKPEMLTRVKFLPAGGDASSQGNSSGTGTTRAVLVPKGTVDDRDGVARVWTVTDRRGDRGVLRSIVVEPGSEKDGWISVRGDIHPGELLVAASESMSDGQLVRILPPGNGGGE